ncbi:hypothetical protein [Sphingomonas sp. SORGH_AS_0879]|uniref:hypothetical protein n=1 Tax=Sphingomonas sp. SORGH_AS_0879 TaxID=3041790 RepID=UPI00277EEBE3|nr:hypothetical protein [Sphingomonas sp. SORGH_AS_0879]MDQ1231713.1 hypothetical protein [Sphingomonas sp. SORGH_AS_0879]
MNTFMIFVTGFALCFIYVWARGGAVERIAMVLQLAAFLAGFAVPRLPHQYAHTTVSWGIFIIDLILLIALAVLAIASRRFWPVWVAGLQAATVIAHVAKAVTPEMLPIGYGFQIRFWGYAMLLLTAVGTWRHCRRKRLLGHDASWKWQAASG